MEFGKKSWKFAKHFILTNFLTIKYQNCNFEVLIFSVCRYPNSNTCWDTRYVSFCMHSSEARLNWNNFSKKFCSLAKTFGVIFNDFTVFENHRKSLLQNCERSELLLHFESTKVNAKNGPIWRVFENRKLAVKQC